MGSWRKAFLLAVAVLGARSGCTEQAARPIVSHVQVKDIGSTSATVTFSSGSPSFAGVSYQPTHGSSTTWTTVNEAYGVDHSVSLKGLNPATQYTFQAWASGAADKPTSTFSTTPTTAAQISTQIEALGKDASPAGNSHVGLIVGGVVLLVAVLGLGIWRLRPRSVPTPVAPPRAAGPVPPVPGWPASPTRALPTTAATPADSAYYPRRLLETARQGARLAVEVDADLLQRAQACTGVTDTAVLVAGALEALIYLETSRQSESAPVYEPEAEGVPRGSSRKG